MSLIKTLHKEIDRHNGGVCPIGTIDYICRIEGRRPSNAERRLRPSESPDYEAVKNSKGFIVGYKKKEREE